MDCLDRFNKRMKISGNSIHNEKLLNSKELLFETFDDDLASSKDNVCFWELNKEINNETETIAIRLYDRKFSAANGTTVQFQTLHDTPIIIGDILYLKNENQYWICTESFDMNGTHYFGKLTLCNWMLKWQNNKGDILEYPCYVINATQYNSGETFNRNITVGSTQHQVTLPCDENTKYIDSPQRFYLDKNDKNPTVYIVTQNDTVSYNYGKKGLVKVTLFQDVGNKDTDRLDLGICDYKEPNSSSADIIDEINYISKIIYNKNIIKSGGSGQKYVAQFTDKNGIIIDNLIPKWKIISDFTDLLDININENEITIKVDNDDLIDEEFKLILIDTNSQALKDEIIIKIESLL